MLSILAAILLLGILITMHELGHFLAARACGIAVREPPKAERSFPSA